MTSTPAPVLAFTDESAASQSHSQRQDPTESEADQTLKNEGFDQEELKQDHENRMAQRSYDLEEGMPAVVITEPDEVSEERSVLSCHVLQHQYDFSGTLRALSYPGAP